MTVRCNHWPGQQRCEVCGMKPASSSVREILGAGWDESTEASARRVVMDRGIAEAKVFDLEQRVLELKREVDYLRGIGKAYQETAVARRDSHEHDDDWPCENSPSGWCEYDDGQETCHYCGAPYERK